MNYEELIKKLSTNEANLEALKRETAAVEVKRKELAEKCKAEFGTDDLGELSKIRDNLRAEIEELERQLGG